MDEIGNAGRKESRKKMGVPIRLADERGFDKKVGS